MKNLYDIIEGLLDDEDDLVNDNKDFTKTWIEDNCTGKYKVMYLKDGTLKLTVNVMCLDYHTDRLFVHEVSLKPLPDGSGYQYAGNKIVYTGDVALPSPQTRIPTQRFTYEGETIAQ